MELYANNTINVPSEPGFFVHSFFLGSKYHCKHKTPKVIFFNHIWNMFFYLNNGFLFYIKGGFSEEKAIILLLFNY